MFLEKSISKSRKTVEKWSNYTAFGAPMPGRKFNSNTYKYGFNGQLKDDEVYGDGNLNTAEYWEYDTRLGRRWNIDPVVKYWQSNYECFSNNPIINVDPKGDDDYFNKDGSFSHSTKSGSKIYIAVDKGYVLLSAYKTYDRVHRIILSKVIQHYSNIVGIKGGIDTHEKRSKGVLAFFSHRQNIANINLHGGMNPLLNDAENLKSTFIHEKAHKETGNGNDGIEHAKVYLIQFQDASYKGAKNQEQSDYAGGQLNAAAGYLNDVMNLLPAEAEKVADEFNKLSDKTGFKFHKVGNYKMNDDGQQTIEYTYKILPVEKPKAK